MVEVEVEVEVGRIRQQTVLRLAVVRTLSRRIASWTCLWTQAWSRP